MPLDAPRRALAPLAITYLLDGTPLFGGVKVALQQANLMVARGHQVTVVSPGEPPAWLALRARFLPVAALDGAALPAADVTVATYWTTIAAALQRPSGEAVQYCQGFEATYTHNVAQHPAILAAYRTPLPALAVAPHLARLLRERFGRPARVVPQPLGSEFRPAPRFGPRRRPRVLVVSPFEIDWKGVPTALRAVARLRAGGLDCTLVRLSQWPLPAAEESLLRPDEFHLHLEPEAVAALMRSCDLLLAPSWEQEGFGLPVLEAMACGVPVVATDIPAFRDFAAGAARLVPVEDVEALAAAAREVLSRPLLWWRLRRAGLAVARRYGAGPAAESAEDALLWVASGAWRSELGAAATATAPASPVYG